MRDTLAGDREHPGGRLNLASPCCPRGILPSLAFVLSSDPLGPAEQQAKQAGSVVPYHSHVQINISNGPNATADATVPIAIGAAVGSDVDVERAAAGKIVQQSPLAGGEAPKNAQVLVFLGAYRAG